MTKTERAHIIQVARLGCLACAQMGHFTPEVEIHHVRMDNGLGQRSSHFDVLPLCHIHHRTGGHGVAFHAGRQTWEREFGTEAELLAQVRRLLENRHGF